MDDQKIDAIVAAVLKELKSQQLPASPAAERGMSRTQSVSGFSGRKINSRLKVSILGAGHGGLAMAGHLTLMGAQVTLFSFFDLELEPVLQNGGIEILGNQVQGFARLEVTKSIDKAVKGADLLMICAPSNTHSVYATLLANLLEEGQVVCLNPGRTGGALEFALLLRRYAFNKRIYLGEAQTFMYAAELRGPGKVELLKEKFKMRAAALPAKDNNHFIQVLNEIYPQIEAGQNVLETSINNVGPVVHPAPMLLNTGVIERVAQGEDLRYYKQQVTPTISNLVMEKVDNEKGNIGHALNLDVWSATDWYRESYHVTGENLYDVLQKNVYYEGFHAPGHLLGYNHILDEVPNSLVALSSIARQLNLKTPTIDVLVDLASAMCNIDFWKFGRTVEKMGLDGMEAAEMLDYVENRSYLGTCGERGVCRKLPQFK